MGAILGVGIGDAPPSIERDIVGGGSLLYCPPTPLQPAGCKEGVAPRCFCPENNDILVKNKKKRGGGPHTHTRSRHCVCVCCPPPATIPQCRLFEGGGGFSMPFPICGGGGHWGLLQCPLPPQTAAPPDTPSPLQPTRRWSSRSRRFVPAPRPPLLGSNPAIFGTPR